MLPYRFDSPQDEQNAAPPAVLVAKPRRARRVGTAALVALALAGGTAGGGLAGAFAASSWQAPQAPRNPVVAAQPAALQGAQASVAGAVYGKVSPAVVEITSSGETPAGPMSYGSGSGVVIDARGLILTNHHVVDDAR